MITLALGLWLQALGIVLAEPGVAHGMLSMFLLLLVWASVLTRRSVRAVQSRVDELAPRMESLALRLGELEADGRAADPEAGGRRDAELLKMLSSLLRYTNSVRHGGGSEANDQGETACS